jgi:hypothetical protein
MKLIKAFIVLFVVMFVFDATAWHGYYRNKYGARLHAAAERASPSINNDGWN